MFTFKKTNLALCFILLGLLAYAQGETVTEKKEDGIPIELIESASSSSPSKINTIIVILNGHAFSIVFLEDLGQVLVEVSAADGGEVETTAVYTPNGVNFYIPDVGSYIVTFTFPDGDVYYGEFEVAD